MLHSATKENNTKLPKELYGTAKNIIFDFNAMTKEAAERTIKFIIYR
jgi:hypothetical protein